ncbi:MAG: hypothetical protein ACYTAN_09295 [Planctomycetota bacterium]|jgi:hypothetical protein
MSENTGGSGNGTTFSERAYETLWTAAPTIGVGLMAISAFVFVFTFPLRLSHHILLPFLVPYFGVPFAAVYSALQLGILGFMRSPKGIALALGTFAVGAGLAWIGMHGPLNYGDVEVKGFNAARHILCGGAIISGFVVGLSLRRAYLSRHRGGDAAKRGGMGDAG